jgi:hypothetical protein
LICAQRVTAAKFRRRESRNGYTLGGIGFQCGRAVGFGQPDGGAVGVRGDHHIVSPDNSQPRLDSFARSQLLSTLDQQRLSHRDHTVGRHPRLGHPRLGRRIVAGDVPPVQDEFFTHVLGKPRRLHRAPGPCHIRVSGNVIGRCRDLVQRRHVLVQGCPQVGLVHRAQRSLAFLEPARCDKLAFEVRT